MSSLLDSTLSLQSSEAEMESILSEPAWLASLAHKRVLHVGKYYPPHMGGIETHLQSLCQELRRFVNLKVLVASDDGQTLRENVDGVEVTRVGTSFNFSSAPVCPAMASTIREAQADLIHIHLPNPTAILAYFASRARGRLVLTYHSDIIRQKILGRAFWPFLRRALQRAEAVIVATPKHISSSPILQKYSERCRVIPYGIEVASFQQPNAEAVEDIRRLYGPRIVLGVGRLVYYKGFEFLIRAMKDVEGHLLIIGDGPLRASLQQEALELGLSDKITFLTDVKDVRPFYHASNVFALSSIARSEAFGIVQLEAMACGVPVVNTNLDSGVTFVSQDGVTGLTVPPADSNALAHAINSLLDDTARSARFGEAGKLRVAKEFSLEGMTRKTLELYAEILHSK